MLQHWIWFATRPNLSDRVKANLLQHFHDAEDIFFAAKDAFDHIEGITEEVKESLRDKNLTEAEEILDACRRENLHILDLNPGDAV